MTYSDLIKALEDTGIPFKEAAWREAGNLKTTYGVYALDDDHSLMAGNRHAERLAEGTIDLFVIGSRGSSQAAAVEDAMDSVGCPWRHESGPTYESDTGYTHWEWVFNILP